MENPWRDILMKLCSERAVLHAYGSRCLKTFSHGYSNDNTKRKEHGRCHIQVKHREKASINAKTAGNRLRWMKIRTGSLHARTATKRSIRKREKNVILLDGVFLYLDISEIRNLHLYGQSVHVRFLSCLSPSAYVSSCRPSVSKPSALTPFPTSPLFQGPFFRKGLLPF